MSILKSMAYNDHAESLTIMLGEKVTLYPQKDCNIPDRRYHCYNQTFHITYNDIYGLTIATISEDCDSGLSYKYDVTALRLGTYQLTVTSDIQAPLFNADDGTLLGYTTSKTTAVYNIKVIDVTQINMPTTLNLLPGDNYTLTPQILEVGLSPELTWTSSNTGVAIVNNNGTIRVLRVGETDITCTAYNGVSATCRLTVVPVIATDFGLEETSCELEPDETITLNPVFIPTNTTDQSVTYKSSNTKVATVDAEGTIRGVNMGTCTITATTNDGSYMSSTCKVIVKPVVTSVKLPTTMDLVVGQSEMLVPVILQDGAETTLEWFSNNSAVAEVSEDGNVYAKDVGTTTITCTATNGVSASCTITVNNGNTEPQPPVTILGDLDGDGFITIIDVTKVIRLYLQADSIGE